MKQQQLINCQTIVCPYCRTGEVTMGDDVETGNGVLLHTSPHCEAFEIKDPLSFVREMPETN
jgi:hypothetical protein